MAESSPQVMATFTEVDQILRTAGIHHAFMGAAAVTCWGSVRSTADVDCVVALDAVRWQSVENELRSRGFTPGKHLGPAEPGDPLPDLAVFWSPSGVRLDVFLAKTDFERAALETSRSAPSGNGFQRVISPEASIVYKLLAHRFKDLADIESIFEARRKAGYLIDWSFIERWCAEWEITDRLEPFRAKYKAPPP